MGKSLCRLLVVGICIYRNFYRVAVEARLYSDVLECLPLDPVAQVRFTPRAVGTFLYPVTYCCRYFLFNLQYTDAI